jgi:zinc protease
MSAEWPSFRKFDLRLSCFEAKHVTMRISPAHLALCLAMLLGGGAPTVSADEPILLFPQPASDLTPDAAIQVTTLPNGLRAAVRANAEPRGRASLRLVVAAGSLHETDAQRGLAHFLEHMAFNGSTHYPPGTLTEFFQRMGMSFGGDTNAYTSFDRTVYMIELPDTRAETVAEGLKVLADFAGGLLLPEAEIIRERGVILAEKQARDSADYRAAVAGYQFSFAGTRLPARLPIGLEEVIRHAPRAEFVDFYSTWYRPERMAVIAVGDFDPIAVAAQITATFTPLAARGPARPEPVRGTPIHATGLVTSHHHEPEASATTVSFANIGPWYDEPDTAARRRAELPRELALAIVNRRLAELAKTETAPFAQANAGFGEFRGLYRGADLDLVARPGAAPTRESLALGENELRRALEFGFRPGELRVAVAEQRNALAQAARTAATVHHAEHADVLVDAFMEGRVPTAPADDLALLGPALDQITVEDCLTAFRAAWTGADHLLVSVHGQADLGADEVGRQVIAKTIATARAQPVAPPESRGDEAFAYTSFGPTGEIVTRTEVADLGVTSVVFANGVRLNLKRTDFAAGEINLSARLGTGLLEEPPGQPGLGFFAGQAFTAGGLVRHSADDLQRLLAGRNVGLGLRVAEDACVFTATTTPADLELQYQLLCAYLTAPGYREEAERTARRQLEPLYTRLAQQPTGPLVYAVPKLLASGDARFGLPRREDAFARTLPELRAWLDPQLAQGALEVALAGDFDIEAALAAAARTLGTLPTRAPKPALTEARAAVRGPATPLVENFTVPTQIPKAVLAFYWPTTDGTDIHRTRRLNLLGRVLDDRLRLEIREKLGSAYSPSARSEPSEVFIGHGHISATITLDPADIAKVEPAVRALAADLATQGVTEDELERARLPVLTGLRESERSNAYWLSAVLASAQEQPHRLDWARGRYADFTAVTRDELNALAAQYLPPTRASIFTVRPGVTTAAP